MGLGIIGAALAAAGDAGVQSMNQRIQHLNQIDSDERRAELEKQKQIAIFEAQKQIAIDSARQMREEQSARINGAAQGVAQGQADQAFADHDAALAGNPTSGTPLTPEQQQVIQSTAPEAAANKANYKAELMNDPQSYVLAAMRTGDLDPQMIANLVQQDKTNKRIEANTERQMAHSERLADKAEANAERRQAASQAFQAGENQKNRDAANWRLQAKLDSNMPPSDITDSEKKNWVHTYVTNNGVTPRSAPQYVKNAIGTWAVQMGVTPETIAKGTAQMKFDQASAVTSGHRAGSMASVEATMPGLADNALQLSKNLGKSNFVPLNQLAQMADDKISDPDLAAFKVAHQALVSEYQSVISRGGTNVTALKEAMHVLNGAQGPEAYAAAVNQVKREVAINVAGTDKVRANIGGSHKPSESVPNPMQPPAAQQNRPSLQSIFGY